RRCGCFWSRSRRQPPGETFPLPGGSIPLLAQQAFEPPARGGRLHEASTRLGRRQMRYRRLGLGGLLLVGLACVAPAQQPRPRGVPEGTKVERNLEYVKDGHERNKLDLYVPEKADGPLPLVVWIHGGGWRNGSKDNCPMAPLVAKGYAVASIN